MKTILILLSLLLLISCKKENSKRWTENNSIDLSNYMANNKMLLIQLYSENELKGTKKMDHTVKKVIYYSNLNNIKKHFLL